MSWKNAYCEKNLVEFLMSHPKDKVLFLMFLYNFLKPPKTTDLKRIYQASKYNVFNLHCTELKYSLNYEYMF